jgi:hypothetical protein
MDIAIKMCDLTRRREPINIVFGATKNPIAKLTNFVKNL